MAAQDNQGQQTGSITRVQKLLQRLSWDKLSPTAHMMIVVVLFGLVGVVATLAISAAELRQDETVVLSNGQEVKLGDSVASLDARLSGNTLVTRDKKIYQYPTPNSEQKIEVLIYTDQAKVVAIHIIGNSENRVKNSDAEIETTREELVDTIENRFGRRFNSRVEAVRGNGYKIPKRRAASYYIFDPCNDSTDVKEIALAYPDYESLFGANQPFNCSLEFD